MGCYGTRPSLAPSKWLRNRLQELPSNVVLNAGDAGMAGVLADEGSGPRLRFFLRGEKMTILPLEVFKRSMIVFRDLDIRFSDDADFILVVLVVEDDGG